MSMVVLGVLAIVAGTFADTKEVIQILLVVGGFSTMLSGFYLLLARSFGVKGSVKGFEGEFDRAVGYTRTIEISESLQGGRHPPKTGKPPPKQGVMPLKEGGLLMLSSAEPRRSLLARLRRRRRRG